METQLTVVKEQNLSIFANGENFELAQRICKALMASDIVPKNYQNNLPNTLIALELANRIGASPLMVMQNLAIIHGKPSFSSTFLIAAINQSGKFSPLRFEISGEGMKRGCIAWAKDADGERLESPKVDMQMAKDEMWLDKPGSKWKTMADLMLRYRAASFFSRLYCPEITMGMQSKEEVEDTPYVDVTVPTEKPKPELLINTPSFERSRKHILGGGNINEISAQFQISDAVMEKLLEPAPVEVKEGPIDDPVKEEPKPERKTRGRIFKDENGNVIDPPSELIPEAK